MDMRNVSRELKIPNSNVPGDKHSAVGAGGIIMQQSSLSPP